MQMRYAAVCAILSGLGNVLMWGGFEANVFIAEPVLHSAHERRPERIGAHDGYYGMAVMNVFYMLSTLLIPSLTNYFRCKWILSLSAACFLFYFLSYQLLNRILFFFASAVLGTAFSAFTVGYSGYLTEFSTRETIEANTALSWGVSSTSVAAGALINLAVTTINRNETSGLTSKYREYSDTEIRYFFGAFAAMSCGGLALFALLPNKEVEGNIAASNVRNRSIVEQLRVMFSVLFHKRVLILVPFYLYIGLFFSFWTSVFPTTFQFTKALSLNVYLPAYFGIVHTFGGVIASYLTMKLSEQIKDFCLKPLMGANALLHVVIYVLCVFAIPEWSTVRPNDEPSLLIEPTLAPILLLAFLFGVADAGNNTTRTVISSLLLPTTRSQTFGASRFYHALASCLLLFISPSLSIYAYVAVLASVLVGHFFLGTPALSRTTYPHRLLCPRPPTIVATIVFFFTCDFIRSEEQKTVSDDHEMKKAHAASNGAFTND